MKKRFRVSRKKSRRNFKKSSSVKKSNYSTVSMRGGYRL